MGLCMLCSLKLTLGWSASPKMGMSDLQERTLSLLTQSQFTTFLLISLSEKICLGFKNQNDNQDEKLTSSQFLLSSVHSLTKKSP